MLSPGPELGCLWGHLNQHSRGHANPDSTANYHGSWYPSSRKLRLAFCFLPLRSCFRCLFFWPLREAFWISEVQARGGSKTLILLPWGTAPLQNIRKRYKVSAWLRCSNSKSYTFLVVSWERIQRGSRTNSLAWCVRWLIKEGSEQQSLPPKHYKYLLPDFNRQTESNKIVETAVHVVVGSRGLPTL